MYIRVTGKWQFELSQCLCAYNVINVGTDLYNIYIAMKYNM